MVCVRAKASALGLFARYTARGTTEQTYSSCSNPNGTWTDGMPSARSHTRCRSEKDPHARIMPTTDTHISLLHTLTHQPATRLPAGGAPQKRRQDSSIAEISIAERCT